MPKLDVYVRDHCWTCEQAEKLVTDMRDRFPDVDIALLDLNPDEWPNEVFAVPTYILDGKVISLGNPSRERLQSKLELARQL